MNPLWGGRDTTLPTVKSDESRRHLLGSSMCDLKSIIKLLSVNFKVLFSCFTVQLLLWFDWKSLEDPGTDPRVGSDFDFFQDADQV